MKQIWEKPELKVHGSIEELTEISAKDIAKGAELAVGVGQFIVSKGFGLFASLQI